MPVSIEASLQQDRWYAFAEDRWQAALQQDRWSATLTETPAPGGTGGHP